MAFKAHFTDEQKKEYIQKTNEKFKSLQKDMLNETANLANDPEKVLKYMEFLQKFPKYSARNRALIHKQRPGAISVASYKDFQAMGYHVLKGEKGIKISVPHKLKLFERHQPGRVDVLPVSQATTAEKKQIEAGKIRTRDITKFSIGTVFDVTQTDMPKEKYPEYYPNRHLDFEIKDPNEVEYLKVGLEELAQKLNVKILDKKEYEKLPDKLKSTLNARVGNAKGQYIPAHNNIFLNPRNTPTEDIAACIHELTHAVLQNSKKDEKANEWLKAHKLFDKSDRNTPRGIAEFEAEMNCYLISKQYGIDNGEKAKRYLAGWNASKNGFHTLDPNQQQEIMNTTVTVASEFTKTIEQTKERIVTRNLEKAPKPSISQEHTIQPYKSMKNKRR